MSSSINLFSLPRDVLTFIISQLPPGEILKFSTLNKIWHELSNNPRLWQAAARSLKMDIKEESAKRTLLGRMTLACSAIQLVTIDMKRKIVAFSHPDPFQRYQKALVCSFNTLGRENDSTTESDSDGEEQEKALAPLIVSEELIKTFNSDVILAAIAEGAEVDEESLTITLKTLKKSLKIFLKKTNDLPLLRKHYESMKEILDQHAKSTLKQKEKIQEISTSL
ncbi:MAG: F-box protein, partial [Anaerolineae bacterium]